MHQSVVTPALPPMGWAGDSWAYVRGSYLLSSPAVTGKCRACDVTQIYPHGIYYYKEQGYDSQQSPQCRAFSRAVIDEKSLSPLFPIGGRAVVTND